MSKPKCSFGGVTAWVQAAVGAVVWVCCAPARGRLRKPHCKNRAARRRSWFLFIGRLRARNGVRWRGSHEKWTMRAEAASDAAIIDPASEERNEETGEKEIFSEENGKGQRAYQISRPPVSRFEERGVSLSQDLHRARRRLASRRTGQGRTAE